MCNIFCIYVQSICILSTKDVGQQWLVSTNKTCIRYAELQLTTCHLNMT